LNYNELAILAIELNFLTEQSL